MIKVLPEGEGGLKNCAIFQWQMNRVSLCQGEGVTYFLHGPLLSQPFLVYYDVTLQAVVVEPIRSDCCAPTQNQKIRETSRNSFIFQVYSVDRCYVSLMSPATVATRTSFDSNYMVFNLSRSFLCYRGGVVVAQYLPKPRGIIIFSLYLCGSLLPEDCFPIWRTWWWFRSSYFYLSFLWLNREFSLKIIEQRTKIINYLVS